MTAALRLGESAVAGTSRDMSGEITFPSRLFTWVEQIGDVTYLGECPTLNFAFTRAVYDEVGGFDESFEYGSDVDFTWRLNDSGYKVRHVPDASIQHDYGAPRRQRRRSYIYGKARARLYLKHRSRRGDILRHDPMAVAYPLFLLGLPLTLICPLYPLLLLIPAWRNRSDGVIKVLVDHLWFGAGVLAELAGR
jgi:GT2 family glycosyltransferase